MYIEDKLYKQILDVSVIATVDVVVLDSDNKILLWLRNNKPLKWIYYIPWWRINKNEKILDAAHRKIKEELGIDIDISKLEYLNVYDDIFDESAFDWITSHCLTTTYVYKLSDSEKWNIKIGDKQHWSLKFFDINDPSLHELVKVRIGDLNYSV